MLFCGIGISWCMKTCLGFPKCFSLPCLSVCHRVVTWSSPFTFSAQLQCVILDTLDACHSHVGLFTGSFWSLLWYSARLGFCSHPVSWCHFLSSPVLFVWPATADFVQPDSCLVLHLCWLVPLAVLFALMPDLLTCDPLSKQCRYVVFYWPLMFNRRCNVRQQNNLDINLGLSEQ